MPLVLELVVLMLAAYAAGIAIGWLIWGADLGAGEAGASHTDDDGDDP